MTQTAPWTGATRGRPGGRDPGRRQRILTVAKRHFTERGFLGTRLEDVALEASCAKGTIYLEFDDKETLLREVVEATFADAMTHFARDVMSLASPLARLRETLRFAYRQHMAEPLMGRLLRDDPELRVLRKGNDEEWKAGAAQRAAMIEEWVDEGIRIGEIRADVDRESLPVLLGALRLLPQNLTLASALGTVSTDRILDAMVDIFAAGLAAPAGPGGHPPSGQRHRPADRPARRTKRAV